MKTGCTNIWMLSGSSSAVVGLVLRLGRVPAPPSQLFKDAPDPTSQGGVCNRNKTRNPNWTLWPSTYY